MKIIKKIFGKNGNPAQENTLDSIIRKLNRLLDLDNSEEFEN